MSLDVSHMTISDLYLFSSFSPKSASLSASGSLSFLITHQVFFFRRKNKTKFLFACLLFEFLSCYCNQHTTKITTTTKKPQYTQLQWNFRWLSMRRWEKEGDKKRRLIGSLLSPECGIVFGSFAYVVCSSRFSFTFNFSF